MRTARPRSILEFESLSILEVSSDFQQVGLNIRSESGLSEQQNENVGRGLLDVNRVVASISPTVWALGVISG